MAYEPCISMSKAKNEKVLVLSDVILYSSCHLETTLEIIKKFFILMITN
jgi:hypothetical protein